MDLVEFLRARLAEDEQVARSATQGRWFWTDPDTSDFPQSNVRLVADQGEWKTCEYFCTWSGEENIHRGAQGKPGHEHRVTTEVVEAWGYDGYGILVDDADAEHIARHDPARVLAEVEAKRRIVERYAETEKRADSCIRNGLSSEPDDEVAERLALEWCCRMLALPHAEHEDYQPEWKP